MKLTRPLAVDKFTHVPPTGAGPIHGRKERQTQIMNNTSVCDLEHFMELSVESPVKSLRLGYPGSGFSFYLTRCGDADAFVKHVRATGLDPMADYDPEKPEDTAPVAKCYPLYGQVLPGIMEESAGTGLCEIHLVVIAQEDPRQEIRHWRHEIGHAASFATEAFPSLCASKAYSLGVPHNVVAVAIANIETGAYVTEFLCEVLDLALARSTDSPASGLPFLFSEVFGPKGGAQ